MRKVLIIGSGGAGKSTFAKRLGEATGIPVVHLDREYWQPGWVEPDKSVWVEKLRQISEQDLWIMDGNYSGTLEMRMAAADTVIFLDLPRTVCIRRILERLLKYRGTNRPDMSEGCNEKLDLKFLLWIWNYPKRTKPKVEALLEKFRNKIDIIRLTSPKAVEEFTAKISQ